MRDSAIVAMMQYTINSVPSTEWALHAVTLQLSLADCIEIASIGEGTYKGVSTIHSDKPTTPNIKLNRTFGGIHIRKYNESIFSTAISEIMGTFVCHKNPKAPNSQ
jgi:hypothetical protein